MRYAESVDGYESPECAPKGSGQCDGFGENGKYCHCPCHTIDLVAQGLLTVEDVKAWHDEANGITDTAV